MNLSIEKMNEIKKEINDLGFTELDECIRQIEEILHFIDKNYQTQYN